jgi:hypothetical protein
MVVRPVFDPALPVEVRDALADLGDRLPPGPDAPIARSLPGWSRRARLDVVRAVGLGAVCALVPAVLACTRMFGRAGRMAAIAAQVVLVAVWFSSAWFATPWFTGLWVAFIVSGAVQLLCTVAAFAWMDAWQLRRGIRRASGHYLTNSDFGPESRALVARAQTAVAAVSRSAVKSAGLLDDAANDLVLSRQEWEIAQVLARGADQGDGNAGLAVRRVEALERYAGEVREADAALAERHAALGLRGAGSAESAAVAEIDDLAENARMVADALRADPGTTGQASAGSPEPRPGDR